MLLSEHLVGLLGKQCTMVGIEGDAVVDSQAGCSCGYQQQPAIWRPLCLHSILCPAHQGQAGYHTFDFVMCAVVSQPCRHAADLYAKTPPQAVSALNAISDSN